MSGGFCADIRGRMTRVTYLHASLVMASMAAMVSWLDTVQHGSSANHDLLNAAHWVLLFLLASAHVRADEIIKTDVEVTWLVYGFLIGEIDTDSSMSVASTVMSAVLFQRHRRKLRTAAEDSVQELPDDEEDSTNTGIY